MKQILIKTKEQFEKLPEQFKQFTQINIDLNPGEIIDVLFYKSNCEINLLGNSQVNEMWDNSQVNEMWDNSQVNKMRGNSQVKRMWDNSQVNEMWDNSQVKRMWDNSQVKEMWGNSQVNKMLGNSQVKEMRGNSQVKEMWGNSQVKEMWGNSQVKEMWDNSQVKEMRDNSQVNEMMGNSQVTVLGKECKINKAKNNTLIILKDCDLLVEDKDISVQIVKIETFKYNEESFFEMYGGNKETNELTLYKVVNPKNNCDYFTGKIKYEIGKTIICPDFDKDKTRQCGGGLHLSPTPEMALNYNKGKILVCKVHKDNFVVYSDDLTKVRCKEVFVVEEYES